MATSTPVVTVSTSLPSQGADTLDGEQGGISAAPDRSASDCASDDMPLPPVRHHWQITLSSHGFMASDAHRLADVLLDTEPRPPRV